jgi:uncharacterized membrane protein YcaP (DUF421 family)
MYLQIASKLLIGYLVLFTITRILGKKSIGQLTPLDFIATLLLSELLGNAIYDKNVKLTEFLFATLLWGIIIFLVEFFSYKFRNIRKITEGRPSILINKGAVDWKELKKNKVEMQELMQMLRANNVFSIQDVQYGILENNGTLSIMKKSDKEPPNRKDLNIPFQEQALPTILIKNGNLVEENLSKHQLNKQWLLDKLKQENIYHLSDVSYAEYEVERGLFIQRFNK